MYNHKNETTRKSYQSIPACIKKEMNVPRMTESARKKEEKEEEIQPEHAGVGKSAIIPRCKESHAACERAQAPEEENNGKANHLNS
jgi:hypothetical protein